MNPHNKSLHPLKLYSARSLLSSFFGQAGRAPAGFGCPLDTSEGRAQPLCNPLDTRVGRTSLVAKHSSREHQSEPKGSRKTMARRSAWSPRSPPRRRRADDDDDEMSTEVLQITMAWERKRKQAEADLRDQLNEAEDTITEMGDKVAKLERDLAAAKHDAEIAKDMCKSITAEKAEIARD